MVPLPHQLQMRATADLIMGFKYGVRTWAVRELVAPPAPKPQEPAESTAPHDVLISDGFNTPPGLFAV